MTPKQFKRFINLYPPYIGAGVKITYIAQNWKELHVTMKVRWYNRNYIGTHFGGSLYSMLDPHLMLLLIKLLGEDYIVLDKGATIDFVKATKKPIKCIVKITDQDIAKIKKATENGEKYLPEYLLKVLDEEGDLVASVNKVIYVKKREKINPKMFKCSIPIAVD